MVAGRSTGSLERAVDDVADLERQLYRLEEQLLRSTTRSSRKYLEELLTEDFLEFGSSGAIYDRASVISALVMESPVAWSIANFKARPLADDVALVTYVATTGDGQSSLRCSIWERKGGRWRMAFHQGTRVQR
jgi:hypothetical protein